MKPLRTFKTSITIISLFLILLQGINSLSAQNQSDESGLGNNSWTFVYLSCPFKDTYFEDIVVSGNTVYALTHSYKKSNFEIFTYKNGKWVAVKTDFKLTGYSADKPTLHFMDNILYVAFIDKNGSGKISIRRLVNNKWEIAGNCGFSGSSASSLKLTSNNHQLFLAYQGYKGNPYVLTLIDNHWIQLGDLTSYDFFCSNPEIQLINDILYLLFYEGIKEKFLTVMKFNGKDWEIIGNNKFRTQNKTSNLKNLIMRNDTLFLVFFDDVNNSYSLFDRLLVYMLENKKWIKTAVHEFPTGGITTMKLNTTKSEPEFIYYSDFNTCKTSSKSLSVFSKEYLDKRLLAERTRRGDFLPDIQTVLNVNGTINSEVNKRYKVINHEVVADKISRKFYFRESSSNVSGTSGLSFISLINDTLLFAKKEDNWGILGLSGWKILPGYADFDYLSEGVYALIDQNQMKTIYHPVKEIQLPEKFDYIYSKYIYGVPMKYIGKRQEKSYLIDITQPTIIISGADSIMVFKESANVYRDLTDNQTGKSVRKFDYYNFSKGISLVDMDNFPVFVKSGCYRIKKKGESFNVNSDYQRIKNFEELSDNEAYVTLQVNDISLFDEGVYVNIYKAEPSGLQDRNQVPVARINFQKKSKESIDPEMPYENFSKNKTFKETDTGIISILLNAGTYRFAYDDSKYLGNMKVFTFKNPYFTIKPGVKHFKLTLQ